MRQSNGYVIGFAVAMTVICGGLLALASTGLKERQDKQIELDTQKQILSAVINIEDGMDIASIYGKQINSYVVNAAGEKVSGVVAEKVDTKKVFKLKDESQKQLPVFEFKNSSGELEAYIIPVYGMGLWNYVFGYVALEKDLNTIKGVSLGHVGETPGLGARITELEVQKRFVGKKFSNQDVTEVIHFIKGENSQSNFSDYEVDGLSGATMTTKGVNAMLTSYAKYYDNYFKTLRK